MAAKQSQEERQSLLMTKNRNQSSRGVLELAAAVLIWASILTSSFDIVLSFELAGVTVRATQLLAAAVFALFLTELVRGKKPRIPVSYGNLAVVLVFNTLWIFRARSFSNALGYDLWLAFNILEILVFSHFLSRAESLNSLIQKYILCFDILAAIGIVQFLLEFADIRFFAVQFGETPYGLMRRANGFTYEPSYYATYMLIGCAACLYLLEKRNFQAMDKRMLYISTALNVTALTVSTSRMGWLLLAAYLIYRSVLGTVRYIRRSKKNKAELAKLLVVPLLVLLLAGAVLLGLKKGSTFARVYTQGFGLDGDAKSAGPRLIGLVNTWTVFKNSPLLGCSLGGLDSEIAFALGVTSYTPDMNGDYSMCVSVEALAAYGLIGACFFFKYIYDTTVGCYARTRSSQLLNEGEKQLIYALLLGHVLVFAALQMNQNILRQPYWAHLAVLSAAWMKQFVKDRR